MSRPEQTVVMGDSRLSSASHKTLTSSCLFFLFSTLLFSHLCSTRFLLLLLASSSPLQVIAATVRISPECRRCHRSPRSLVLLPYLHLLTVKTNTPRLPRGRTSGRSSWVSSAPAFDPYRWALCVVTPSSRPQVSWTA